jgi:[ribosomal protein S5]-alanine N-acetyltransferase
MQALTLRRMTVELLPMDGRAWERMAEDPQGFASTQTLAFGAETDLLRAVAQQMVGLLEQTGATMPPWSGFLAVDRAQAIIVGTCGFKAPPDRHGIVEIAYFTFPGFEGRGVASAMAAGLLESAHSDAQVRRFVAHTLPQRNASVRVLEKLGFAQTAEVVDPDDGPVWRWERDRS